MNRASSATGWVRNPIMKSPDLDPTQASSYELGWTSNPITGCLNGCEYCYARKLANTRLRERYLANKDLAPIEGGASPSWSMFKDPFYPRLWEDRLNEPLHKVGKPLGIFLCDMSDLFGIGIPEEWTRRVLSVIRACSSDRFYLLTKQPQNLIKFSPFPDNCWVGVSATNHWMFASASILLGDIKASVKYISIEPLLSWGDYPANELAIEQWAKGLTLYGINQVIMGAQTKPYKPPEISWVEEIVRACDKAGIPVFLKDNLKPLLFPNLVLPLWARTPHSLTKLRQELPQ